MSFHRFPEYFAVFRLLDDIDSSPDHFHIVFFQDSRFSDLDGHVECSLTSQGRQQGIGAIPFDNLLPLLPV